VHHYQFLIAALLGFVVAGCGSTTLPPALTSSGAPMPGLAAIETDAAGRCIGRAITPAVIETITAQELDTPAVLAPDGTVLQPARYRSVIRQNITRDRQEILFETMCPPAFTHEFVSTLQRALATRGYYQGPISGILDTATGRAVQDYQRGIGPDSPLLSIGAARALGIVSLSEEQLQRMN
jgi:Putative peptidoglycan binding domain